MTAQALDENGDPIPGATGQCSFTVDRTPPTTTATVDPSGWSQQATVTLAADDGTGSGVVQTLYSINGGPEQVYTGPFTVATEGAQVSFASTDMAGNQEATQTVSPKVDTTAPVTTDDAGSAWHAGPWSLTLTPTDPLGPDGSHSGMSGGSATTAVLARQRRELAERHDCGLPALEARRRLGHLPGALPLHRRRRQHRADQVDHGADRQLAADVERRPHRRAATRPP